MSDTDLTGVEVAADRFASASGFSSLYEAARQGYLAGHEAAASRLRGIIEHMRATKQEITNTPALLLYFPAHALKEYMRAAEVNYEWMDTAHDFICRRVLRPDLPQVPQANVDVIEQALNEYEDSDE